MLPSTPSSEFFFVVDNKLFFICIDVLDNSFDLGDNNIDDEDD